LWLRVSGAGLCFFADGLHVRGPKPVHEDFA
jgi:hypothetical protein